jgi:hypothetical protein
MKAGTENKSKVRIAILLVIVAILAMTWALLPGGAPKPVPSESAAIPARGKPAQTESLDPRLHLDLLATSEDVKYQGKGKNIFRAEQEQVALPKVKVPPLLSQQNVNVPPPPPPITLKFFGVSSSKGEKPKVFLSQGDDIWIAHEGDVVNRHYKIVRISPNAVEVEDLLNNNRQNIPLT